MGGQWRDSSRQQRLTAGLTVALSVAAAVTGVLLAATHPSKGHHHHGALFVAAFVAVTAIVVAALTLFVARRLFRRPSMRRLLGWDLSQRRATARAVQKGEPVSAEQHKIAEAQLENLTTTSRRLMWTLPLTIAMFAVVAVTNVGGLRILWLTLVVIEAVCLPLLILVYRRQLRRLRHALSRRS